MPNSYLNFMQANEALSKCMAAQDVAAYQAMNAADQGKVCTSEASAVKSVLESDNVSFRNLLAERIAAVNAQQ